MKKIIVGAAAVGAVVMATAAVADVPEQVLSIRRLTVGDSVEVSLPTIQKSDGSVCMAYAADVSRDSLGKITVKVGEVCGKEGVAKVNERGGIEMWPSNLRVLVSEVRHGLTMRFRTWSARFRSNARPGNSGASPVVPRPNEGLRFYTQHILTVHFGTAGERLAGRGRRAVGSDKADKP